MDTPQVHPVSIDLEHTTFQRVTSHPFKGV